MLCRAGQLSFPVPLENQSLDKAGVLGSYPLVEHGRRFCSAARRRTMSPRPQQTQLLSNTTLSEFPTQGWNREERPNNQPAHKL
jgi:hypothetical protein